MPTGIEDMLVRLRELAPDPLIAAASDLFLIYALNVRSKTCTNARGFGSRDGPVRKDGQQIKREKSPFQQERADGARSKFGTEHRHRREVGPRPRAVVQSICSLVRVRDSALQSSDVILAISAIRDKRTGPAQRS
jgi:hypothetical protein